MIEFEWDEKKRLANIRRHQIDFADAYRVFEFDRYLFPDDRFDYGEERWVSLGLLFGEVVAVTHTETYDLIRIISVRKAEKYEQEIYFKSIRD